MSYFRTEWIKQHLGNTNIDVIFDIGSYNGHDGLIFKNLYPNARVISIEADSNNYKKMTENTKLKSLEMYYYAVCDTDAGVEFHPNKGIRHGSGSIHKPTKIVFKFPGMDFDTPHTLPGIRLDSFCKNHSIDHIDIIHMDIQSAEYEALVGLGNLRPKMIFLEVGALAYYENTKPVQEKLNEMGYKKIDIDIKGDELWVLK